MKHQNWIDATCGSDSVRRIAIESGLPQRTLANQVEKDAISAENVIKIAIAYDAHPVRALVDTGYLDEKYARSIDPATAVKEVSEEVLANEVLERMHRGLQTDALTTPVDELASRREGGVDKQFKGADWRSKPKPGRDGYAADSSPREPQMGDDGYHDGP